MKRDRLINDKIIDSPCLDDAKMDCVLKEIGRRVCTEMHNQKLTIADLVDMTGIATTHLYRIESGKSIIGLKALIKVAYALDRPIQDFIPFEEPVNQFDVSEKFRTLTSGFTTEQMDFVFQFIENFKKLDNFKTNS